MLPRRAPWMCRCARWSPCQSATSAGTLSNQVSARSMIDDLMPLRHMCRRFWCRKGFYALNVQAICDSRRRFLDASIKCPGSVNDNLAFGLSGMFQWLHAGGLLNVTSSYAASEFGLPRGFWIAGDNAYSCTDSLVVPYPGTDLEADQDNFNFYHVWTDESVGVW